MVATEKDHGTGWLGSLGWTSTHCYTVCIYKYTLLYSLLYSTWNSAQCYVAARMRGEFGGEWLHGYIQLSPFASHLSLHC